ncbi:MAG TPA: hypothetical protein VMT19_04195 [Thermoanaerobaculaceae bacterium]|nr:hypothetical protein [Thermoanaerobaculaceae bacterium]
MRRTILACILILGATAALAASPYYLDRSGILWTATPDPQGLILTGQQEGVQVVQSVVPFPVAISGATDSNIQVAADDLTGKVAVVWQRNWSATASEMMLAVWSGGSWERVVHLSQDLATNPRNPAVRLTTVSDTVPDPSNPTDTTKATLVQDSFLHVAWWEGTDESHGMYALLQLTADGTDATALNVQDLDAYSQIGLSCDVPVPATTLEHPVFASQDAPTHAQLLVGSQRLCLLLVLEVHFILDPNSGTGSGTIMNRRRHTPIFGVTAAFPMNRDFSMDGTRVILGANLSPVAYRVADGAVQYVTFANNSWSPVRTLAVTNGLTMDQAIPLVENLAR